MFFRVPESTESMLRIRSEEELIKIDRASLTIASTRNAKAVTKVAWQLSRQLRFPRLPMAPLGVRSRLALSAKKYKKLLKKQI